MYILKHFTSISLLLALFIHALLHKTPNGSVKSLFKCNNTPTSIFTIIAKNHAVLLSLKSTIIYAHRSALCCQWVLKTTLVATKCEIIEQTIQIVTIGALLYICSCLLLVSGDIEPNPGPLLYALNIWSLRNKVDVLLANLPDGIDILCISETKIDRSILDDDVLVPGFSSIFRKDFVLDSGGVCLQLSNSVAGSRLLNYEQDDLELMWVKVTFQDNSIILGVGYRNPALPVSYWEKLQSNISEIAASFEHEKIVIVGDFNDDLLNPNKHYLNDIIDSFSFHQLVTEPTRITVNSRTLLDPIIVGNPQIAKNITVLPRNCSDHCPVMATISSTIRTTSYKRQIWLYKRANWRALKRELAETPWQEYLSDANVNVAVERFNSILLQKCKTYIPIKTVKFTSKDKQWITAEIKLEIKNRDKLFNKAKRSGDINDFQTFKHQRNLVTKLIRTAKMDHLSNLTNKLTGCNSEKEWWKLVKTICGTNQSTSIPALLSENETITCPRAKAELFNNFFANICNVDETNIPDVPDYEPNDEVLNKIEISMQDVLDQLNQLDTSKATGPDGLGAKLIKNLKNELSVPIYILFKRSTESEVFPTCWKQANVIPIYKKGNRNEVGNYRPVSLLCIISKLLEKIVYKYTFNHVKSLITPDQSGFLPNHSTVTQLLELSHNMLKEMDEKKEMYILFCDISKAFDRTSHKGLLIKISQLGIRGGLLNWFRSYLSNRQQRVLIEGQRSTWRDIFSGVPQGSVLGPLLFLLYINDLGLNINLNMRLFADDATHAHASKNLTLDQLAIQRDINQLNLWGIKWAVTYCEIKTEYMIASRKNNPTHLHLDINDVVIRQVKIHKHLGFTLNDKMTWHEHITNIITKANRRLGILKKLKYKCDRQTLLKLYTAYVRSIMEYGDVVWDNIPAELSDRLEYIQVDALRCITGITISVTRKNLYTETGIQPLSKRRKIHRLIMFYKILNNLAPNYLKDLIPATTNQRHQHQTRDNLLTPFRCRTESFQKSFFPTTTREWNLLNESVKNSPTLSTFKSALLRMPEFAKSTPPPWFNSGSRPENIYLTRMRNKCSGLSNDLYNNFISESPICQNCAINVIESPKHFLFDCPKFANERQIMLTEIDQSVGVNDLNSDLLMQGSEEIPYKNNIILFESVTKYIKNTKRFC